MADTAKELGLSTGNDKARKYGWFIRVRGENKKWAKRYFRTEAERDAAFKRMVKEVGLVGVKAATEISVADRLATLEMKRLAEPTGLTVMEVFERGLAQVGGHTRRRIGFANACELFMAEQDTRRVDRKISQRRYDEVRIVLDRLKAAYGSRNLSEVDRAAIKLHINRLGVGPQTRVNHARIYAFFFNWCIEEGYLFQNPVPAQEGVDRIPVVFGVEEVKRVLRIALERFDVIVPMLAVQWFAGLRPGASQHLTWPDVDFERKRIIIQPHGNKLRQPDIVQDIPDAAFEWLAPYRRESGLITPKEKQYLHQQFHHAAGYCEKASGGMPPKPWPADVSRHTFASNLVAIYDQDVKRVSSAMLHSTTRMLFKHYLAKNLTKESGLAYFALRREHLMPAQAASVSSPAHLACDA